MAWTREVIIFFWETNRSRKQQEISCSQEFSQRCISYSAHYKVREKERNLDRNDIIRVLNGGLEGIIAIEDRSERDEIRSGLGLKYMILFKKDARHDIHLIVSRKDDGSYNVVSAREQNVKKRGVYKRPL